MLSASMTVQVPASPPEPAPTRSPRRWFIVALVAALVIAGLSGAVIYLMATRNGGAEGAASPSTSVTPTPPPSPGAPATPKPPKIPAVVISGSFNAGTKASGSEGRRVTFWSEWTTNEGGCQNHAYTEHRKTHTAFFSDCSSWEPEYDVLLFRVGFRNTSDRVVTLNLHNLVLQSRDGRSFGTVDVRSHAEFPPFFLSGSQKLTPKSTWHGWVAFDGRVTGMVPASMSYIDGKQTLRQVFEGMPSIT